MSTPPSFWARARKALVGLGGVLAQALILLPPGVVPDEYKPLVALIVSTLTAVGVFLTPNAQPSSPLERLPSNDGNASTQPLPQHEPDSYRGRHEDDGLV